MVKAQVYLPKVRERKDLPGAMTSQLSLMPTQEPPSAAKRPRRRHTTRKGPRCAVAGCERPWGFRKTFTEYAGFKVNRSGWVSVELCGPHGRQLTTAQMHKLAK